jgi:acyl-CoA reductase-like NAD-dependent aldehyde dehydrogenase
MQSVNPFSNKLIAEYTDHSDSEVLKVISAVYGAWEQWKNADLTFGPG